jgi:hypothetical protein
MAASQAVWLAWAKRRCSAAGSAPMSWVLVQSNQ